MEDLSGLPGTLSILHFSAPWVPLIIRVPTGVFYALIWDYAHQEPVSTVTMKTTVMMQQFDCNPAHWNKS